MVHSRVFIFFAVTLCFVACLCVQATVSEAEAIKAVHDAERSIVKAMKKAEYELREAKDVKRDMEWYKEKADKKVSEANATAQVAEAAAAAALIAASNKKYHPSVQTARTKRKAAQDFARDEKNKLENADKAYPNAKADTDRAIQSLNNMLSQFHELDQKAIEVLFITNSPIDYTKVKENALSIKSEAEALEKEVENATKLLSGAKDIIWEMPSPTTEEFIEKHKDDGIVAGAVFDTIEGEADSIVDNIKYQKNQVNQSVETIKKFF